MQRILAVFLSCAFFVGIGIAADGTEIHFKPEIKKVMVFTSGEARLTRSGSVALKKGKNIIKTSPSVLEGCGNPGDVRVSFDTPGLRLESVDVRYEPVDEEDFKQRIEQYKLDLEAISDNVFAIEQEKNLLQQEERTLNEKLEMLSSFRKKLAEKVGHDAKNLQMNVEDWQKGIALNETESMTTRKALVGLKTRRRELDRRMNQEHKRRSELQQKNPGNEKANRLYLTVTAAQDCNGIINLTHEVRGASWRPSYRVAANVESRRLKLEMFANVNQRSKEDWRNVDLSFSTARPELGTDIPVLTPWKLRDRVMSHGERQTAFGIPRTSQLRRAPNAPMDVEVGNGSPFGFGDDEDYDTFGDDDDDDDDDDDEGDAMADTVSIFKAENPADVSCDGHSSRVLIASFETDFELEHVAVPKVQPYAFMLATAGNKAAFPLPKGIVEVNVGESFVGKGFIKSTAPGERMKLGLGVDQNLKVSIRTVDSKVERKRRGDRVQTTNAFEIKVANYGTHPAKVTLYDQVPASDSPDIKVVYGSEARRALREAEFPGQLSWEFELQPGKTRTVDFDFTIDYPEVKRRQLELANEARFQDSLNRINKDWKYNMKQMVPKAKF